MERPIVEVGGASEIINTKQPSSTTGISITSSLLEEVSDRSWFEHGGASGRGGRIGLALQSLSKALGLSPQLGH